MADNTLIEWTDATWNPVTGCSVVSPGCTNCYAMRLAGTRLKHVESRKGLTIDSKAGPVWNGEVRFNEKDLDQPLRWKRPRLIFVCAHGDLFHENVPDEWIDRVFAVMALAPQHTFQVLTKRSARMREYMTGAETRDRIDSLVEEIAFERSDPHNRRRNDLRSIAPCLDETWPLPNVWLGVSAEDQARADERIPDLLATPAAVRFVSAEPLLGPIHLGYLGWPSPGPARRRDGHNALLGRVYDGNGGESNIARLDWVIVGGESGPGARPMHPDWARSLRDQCAAAGVAFHFKQWGEFGPVRPAGIYPDALDRRDWTDGTAMLRLGKKAAGRLLDGIAHNGMPAIAGTSAPAPAGPA